MKPLRRTSHTFLKLAFACLAIVGLSSCEEQTTGSVQLNLGSQSGTIIRGSTANCVDRKTYATSGILTRSVKGPALVINGVSLEWLSETQKLYVDVIRVTVQASRISGGKKTFDLDVTEIEALLGAPNGVIGVATRDTLGALVPEPHFSTNTAKAGGFPACALAIGTIDVTNPDSDASFNAQVTLQLYGTASEDKAGGQINSIRKTITTTAVYN